MANTARGTRLRVAFSVLAVGLMVYCLLGILLTGPVVVKFEPLELDIPVSAERLKENVAFLCSAFGPRDYEHPENLERTAAWIAGELRAAGYAVRFQDYMTSEGSYRNVIAHQPGTIPEAGSIVIGAHYDVFAGFPGADDNASGVAAMLELARTLPQRATREGRYFVAFSTEEPPFFGTDEMGSAAFARELVDDEIKVSLMLSLDMVGYYNDSPRSQRHPFPGLGMFYPRRANFVAVVGDLRSGDWILRTKRGMISTRTIDVVSFRAPKSAAPVLLSDHQSFRELGLPGVQVTDTSFMRFDAYHTPRDTPERLDYERLALVVRALHGVLWDSEVESP